MKSKREPFPELLARHASAGDLVDWIRRFSKPRQWNAQRWADAVVPVACTISDLTWLSEDDQDYVRHFILNFVQGAFTRLWVPLGLVDSKLYERLEAFIQWIEAQPDEKVVSFCWELLLFDRGRILTPDPVHWLRNSGRLAGAYSYENLNLAVSLTDEADTMHRWPKARWQVTSWKSASDPYLQLLSHSSYLVRAAAAKALGRVFHSLSVGAIVPDVPRLSDMLNMIQEIEVKTAGVAGAFFQGAWMDAEWSKFGADFDMNSWILETLRKSSREPVVPHVISLEFYAHEWFSGDAGAIREFLKMGRRDLAFMTATEAEEPIPQLQSLHEEMAASSDPALSAAIREYLGKKTQYAGHALLRKLDGKTN